MNKYSIRSFPVTGQYPFLVILSACIAGILLQQWLQIISTLIWFCTAFFIFGIAVVLHLRRSINSYIGTVRIIAILATFLTLGCTLSSVSVVSNTKSWYGHFTGKNTECFKVTVKDLPILKANTVLVPVTVNAVNISGKWATTTGNLNVYIYRKGFDSIYQPGQVLIIPAKLVAIKKSGNPFSFDMVKLYERKGISHQAFISAKDICLLKSGLSESSFLLKFRETLNASIHTNIKDSTTCALVAATLLNERNELDDDLMAAYSNTGIIHIIAISGMHIVLLAAAILWVLKLIPAARWKGPKYAIAIVIVWLYIALTGFPPSAVRAAVMFTLMAIGLSLNRTSNPINIWGAAGLLVLCYNPFWLYDVGIQLSFLAVLSILLFYLPVKRWFAPATHIAKWLWEVIAVSIAAQILVFPLVIYYFQQFPLFGIVANVPAAIYSTILMFGGLIIFVLDAVHCSASWVGILLTYLTKAFNGIIIFLSDITPQLMRDMYINPFQYWLMMGIVIAICIYCFNKKAINVIAALSFCIIFVADLIAKDATALHQERLVVYNINKRSQADLFTGKKVTHLFATDLQQIKYNMRPAMLGFGINKECVDTTARDGLIQVKSSNVVFLSRCNVNATASFPVDILVISNQCVFSPQQWFEAFHPSQIILDGSIPRWKAMQWKTVLTEAGAQVHWVQEDGAFVYPSL